MEFIARVKGWIYRLHLSRRTEKDNSLIWSQWKQASAHKSGIWSLAMPREIRRDTDQTKTLHENTRDRLIKQELNILALFTHTKHICCYLHVSNRRYASQDIFKALLLGFESTVCSLCLDIRKVLESGECEWWQNLQLFMNAVRCVSLWVCGGTAPLESSWDRISLARTRRVSRAAN